MILLLQPPARWIIGLHHHTWLEFAAFEGYGDSMRAVAFLVTGACHPVAAGRKVLCPLLLSLDIFLPCPCPASFLRKLATIHLDKFQGVDSTIDFRGKTHRA